MHLRRLAVTAMAGALTTVLAGCGLGTAGGFTRSGDLAGPLSDVKSLSGLSITVGSKNFTEQILLGKMAVILLKSDGAHVEDLTNIPGSASQRQAMLSGDIGFEWEYTGTAWISYLGHENPIPDSHKQYVAVKKEEERKNQLTWLPPAPMNNTYGFAAKAETAKKLGVTKLSDLADLDKSQRTFCVESEFKNRNDGFEPMLKKYDVPLGSEVPKGNVKTLQTGAIYAATDQGACNFGEVFTTDGRIKALNLTVLKDDRHFFPLYNVCPVFLDHIVEQYPQVRKLFGPVAKKLTSDTLRTLNARIDVKGQQPQTVAYDWLQKHHFLK